MILYSWKKVYQRAYPSSRKLLKILYYITFSPVPQNRDDEFYEIRKYDYFGSNFIVHPEPLFQTKGLIVKELMEYVGLASYRSYAEYKTSKVKTLDLIKSPLNEDIINSNSLLRLKDDKIHFKFEEAKFGEYDKW